MKIASWNVNSLKVRLPQLLDWLAAQKPAVVCLQETKLDDPFFPKAELEAAGYHVVFSGQKTYNGVALLTREPPTDVVFGNPLHADPQKRLLAATVSGICFICAYVPNGQAVGSDKYAYKLAWLDALIDWIAAQLAENPRLVLAGDFNIAPDDRDVHDPAAWAGQILCSAAERAAFQRLLDLGLRDSFRLFEQPEKSFSWWDYRMLGFQKNRGLRIDHILLSTALAGRCTGAEIKRDLRKLERPSDHAPVTAELAD
ncbi:MAG: Exodeoxyribonuclease III [Candidatus Accumulibacter regalis]|jgi:exodeoxyribonuclease-3|uniref:Exodeoxyribonuclease III n=2 Tax=Candidatus Accumulibacter TaxID=327159 RepID=A0A011P0G1_ACCRE|nr:MULTISPECIES: exodeoxyribonuclease III [unclassified Candidatus Accumulibacter]EXI88448.1 MAG: Exodeoxyribonuclease III [Candidatus Accumulibacter regalis]MQM34622.1 exodeoxyribonuclease III [Candidatus Accumulibacter phosphatis]MBN8513113.1 exodeoxyribonuclease III [Accumulibacter sp.]HRE71053.1 exodeoxyribonuclease III [Accumulibacter sp.]HRE86756.1 exodeoxyribonuclease III [Accumulibacter sp.]